MKQQFLFLFLVSSLLQGFTQNVGIGTNVPLSKLGVSGNFALGGAFSLQPAPTNGAIIEGDVGIGTAAPTAQLHTTSSVRFEGLLQNNTYSRMVFTDNNGNLAWCSPSDIAWLLSGNSGTNANTNFIGTTDNQAFCIKANNDLVIRVSPQNSVGVANVEIGQNNNANGSMTILSKDVTGYGMPLYISSSIAGLTWNYAGANTTLGRLMRLNQGGTTNNGGTNFCDIGIGQNQEFFITEMQTPGLGAYPKKMITISPNDNVGINMDFLTLPTANFHTIGTIRFENLISANGNANQVTQVDASGNFSALISGVNGQVLSQGISGLTWISPQDWLLTGNTGTNPSTNFIGTTDNIDWVMKTNNIERARIKSSGRFGVNTSSPMSKLALVDRFSGDFTTLNCCSDLAGFSIFDNTDFVGITTIDRDGNLATVDDADGMIYWGDNPNDQDLFFTNLTWNGASLTRGDRMIIKANGNIGIGTNAPTQRFHVFNGTTNGTYTTTGWVHSSDKRLKENIEPISNSMYIINSLNGVWYEWKNNKDAGRQVGFIAQEVKKVLPEVVVGIEGDIEKGETLGMAYQNIVPILVEALKEKDKEIVELDDFRSVPARGKWQDRRSRWSRPSRFPGRSWSRRGAA